MAKRARGIPKSVHSPEQAAFRDLLIRARRKASLTQRQLADRIGKPQSFIAKYEGGERRLDVVEFVAIMRAMEDDPVRLLRVFLKKIA
jgi:transcriptional regulator with XRE-family HTH domain